jgi:D-glycero-D-manno-heptose 1,7-bisphosphate phosphatase
VGDIRKEVRADLQKSGEDVSGRHAAVFLDRDGTINEELHFIRHPDQLVMIDGAAAAVKTLNDCGFITCVISNQSGIARGFLTEDDLASIHVRLANELAKAGAHIDRIYYCPHHPTEGQAPYRIECECRKPKPGMLDTASVELDIDLTRSFVVGDRLADIQAGKNAGARTILVLTGYGRQALEELKNITNPQPDCIAEDLPAAVEFITHTISRTPLQND